MVADQNRIRTDLLILGGGGAAAMAALRAGRGGAEVAIVSKEASLVGGATIQSSGGISSLFDPDDSPEIFYRDLLTGGGDLNNRKLARILSERSTAGLRKLEEYGYRLDRDGPGRFHKIKRSEGHSYPRGYLDRREGVGFCHALEKALIRNGVTFFPDCMIVKLLLNDGQAVGALGFDLVSGEYVVFNAKAVILATGGIGQIYELTTNAKSLTGDGCGMAWEVGAKLVDMEMVQFIPHALPYPASWKGLLVGMTSLWGPSVRLYNGLGERYMEKYDPERMEYTTRDIAARANFTEIIEGRGTKGGTIVVDPTRNDPELLAGYVESLPQIYGRVQRVFGPEAAGWRKPFETIPSQHFFMGGVVIDEACRTSIPGLFAVGEVSGGVHGANRLAGTALAEIFVFGDLAGESAAKWIEGRGLIPPRSKEIVHEIARLEESFNASPKDGVRPFEIKEKVREIMWKYVGPVREEKGLREAAAILKGIEETDLERMAPASGHSKFNQERVELCESRFMVRTARLVTHAALHRKESRGSHYRSDFPHTDNSAWLRNIVMEKGPGDEINIVYADTADDH